MLVFEIANKHKSFENFVLPGVHYHQLLPIYVHKCYTLNHCMGHELHINSRINLSKQTAGSISRRTQL